MDYGNEVNNLYNEVLGRNAEDSAKNVYGQWLQAHNNDLSGLTGILMGSQEYKNDVAKNPNFLGQQFANAFTSNIAAPPPEFTQILPFNNYFNATQYQNLANSTFAPYYNELLNNYQNQYNLRNQNYSAGYNTQKNYLNTAQQNFLNYNTARNAYNQAQLANQYQGSGTGSSSAATSAMQDQANTNQYNVNQQNLQTQTGLAQNQSDYNYNTGMNNQDLTNYQLQQNQSQKMDQTNYYNQLQSQATQQYNSMMQNYYDNYNNGAFGPNNQGLAQYAQGLQNKQFSLTPSS